MCFVCFSGGYFFFFFLSLILPLSKALIPVICWSFFSCCCCSVIHRRSNYLGWKGSRKCPSAAELVTAPLGKSVRAKRVSGSLQVWSHNGSRDCVCRGRAGHGCCLSQCIKTSRVGFSICLSALSLAEGG